MNDEQWKMEMKNWNEHTKWKIVCNETFFFKGEYIAEVVEFFYFFTGIWILRIKN